MQDSENNWMNIADIMAALMMIFMFIAITFLYQILNEKEIYKVTLNKALHEEFDKDLKKWKAIITEDNIMRFNAPFKVGGNTVPKEFALILSDYFPRYIEVLSNEKFKNEIEEIRVEGHTSNGWGNVIDKKKVYLKNMYLSQERASNVLAYCYDLNNSTISKNLHWLQNNLRANGMSFSKLLHKKGSNKEDKSRSRRVEFKVLTKDKLNEY